MVGYIAVGSRLYGGRYKVYDSVRNIFGVVVNGSIYRQGKNNEE